MKTSGFDRMAPIAAVAAALAILLIVASAPSAAPGRSAGEAPPAAAPTPASAAAAPGASPAPEASPSPAPSTAPAEEPLPRIIRTVCTDHVCGGCDGRCRKTSGHVAIDKKGHCACTPAEGSPLDRAVRQAYERHPPQ